MSSLPSGTVTFLFTDIEGSTKLAQEHTDSWEDLRERHHAILRRAIEANRGYVFQIIGDAFCVTFHTAVDGLNAAVEMQQNLQKEDWGEAQIKVRMGLHTGSAELHGNDYRGFLTMAKVQRIMSVAYGGQVLLSNVSAELIHNELSNEISLRDLNEHRLKGLPDPERLWQVVAPELVQDFPPLQSLKDIPNNLPARLTTFIGREKEIDQIKKRLEEHRLVTLTGSGGVGKTRLSIQVAAELLDQYPHGVWLVELAPITDPSLVAQTVCTALDITPQGNVSALSALINYLKTKKLLFVVDNCEHLIDACAQLCDSLLHACPNLRMITSSREALGVEGESAYRVPSLSLPNQNEGLQAVKGSEAVKLFMERAKAVLPEFELTEINAPFIAQICQRLDGIALAIELAASRVKLLKVEQIASRLDDVFRLLTGGSRTALLRQQTLRALIDWSYNLLSEEEKAVLQYLSVFVGGWTLESAEFVCDNPNILDSLTHLADKSLVTVDLEHGDEPRYYLLEIIRQYAREKLIESGENHQTNDRHLHYFLTLAETAEPELYGAGQIVWLQKLEDEYENMRAALEWSIRENSSAGQQLAAALWWFWDLRGHLQEGYEWLRKMLAVNQEEETLIRAKLLAGAGWLAGLIGYSDEKEAFAEKSVALYQKLGDRMGIAIPLITLGSIASGLPDYEKANKLLDESLNIFKNVGNHWGVAFVLGMLSFPAQAEGNYEQAWKSSKESLRIFKEIGDSDAVAWTLYIMGRFAESQGDDAQALDFYEEALHFAKVVKSKPVTSWILRNLGNLSIRNSEYEKARALYEAATEITQKMGDIAGTAYSLQSLGWIARLNGEYAKSQSCYRESLQLVIQLGNMADIAECLLGIGQFLGTIDSSEKFVLLLGMAERTMPVIQQRLDPGFHTETKKFIETVRSELSEEAYTTAYDAGKQMSFDEAIAYVLKELEE